MSWSLAFPIVGSREITTESTLRKSGGLGVPSFQNVKILMWDDIDCTYIQQPINGVCLDMATPLRQSINLEQVVIIMSI